MRVNGMCFLKNLRLTECIYENELSISEKMTWTNGEVSSKIDKIFHNIDLKGEFLYTSIRETFKTDHKAVFTSIKIEYEYEIGNTPKKYKPWRLNDKILDEKEVIDGITEICKKIPSLKLKHGKKGNGSILFEYYSVEELNALLDKLNINVS